MKTTFKSKEDILSDIKLLDHALINGYQIDKAKSTINHMKLKGVSTGDTIMVNPKKNMYYNMDYPNDKGDLIQFVANRLNGGLSVDHSKEAFYAALVSINKGLGNYLKEENKNILSNKNSFIEKKEKIASMQSNEWNHVPIINYNFLNNSRAINMETLQSDYFKDRIFNTYVKLSNDHIITNTAFGLYKKNELVGLEIRNNGIKMILGDNTSAFYTNTEGMKKIDSIFYAESVIDIASIIEILKNTPDFEFKNYCFISFSGFLYESKLSNIINELDELPITKNTQYVSLTDNDFDKKENENSGKQYDVTFTAALINKHITPLEFTTNEAFFNFQFNDKNQIDIEKLKEVVSIQNDKIDTIYDAKERYGKYLILKETETNLTLNLPRNINLEQVHFSAILKALQAERLYVPHKPKKRDWKKEDIKKEINTEKYVPKFSKDPIEELNSIINSKEYKPVFVNDWNDELKYRKGLKAPIKIEKKNDIIITPKNKKNGIRT